mmetsp:Transcript_20640/g.57506  ORF Transcript_20640/g.57506 Transcript_20640/m.57506 type:complete len:266 (-) Transcript_20640:171-968(-)
MLVLASNAELGERAKGGDRLPLEPLRLRTPPTRSLSFKKAAQTMVARGNGAAAVWQVRSCSLPRKKPQQKVNVIGFNHKFCAMPMEVPRPLTMPHVENNMGAVTVLMWQPQINPRVSGPSGMLLRLEKLRQAAIALHRGIQDNREAIATLRQHIVVPGRLTEEEPFTAMALDVLRPSRATPQQSVEIVETSSPSSRWLANISIDVDIDGMSWSLAAPVETTPTRSRSDSSPKVFASSELEIRSSPSGRRLKGRLTPTRPAANTTL